MSDIEDRLLMLIDDEPAQIRLVSALAAREGWRTIVARDSETAIATLGTRQGMRLGAIILDQWVPGESACDLIAELKARRPALPILMITTSSSPLLAVEAMRAGATDYLIKPVSPDRLVQALRAATAPEVQSSELHPLTEKLGAALDFDSMIGAASSFRTALAVAAKAAPLTAQDFPRLANLLGETARVHQPISDGAGVTLFGPDGNLRPLEEIEADVIRLAIGHYRGRMTEVARRLGIGRSTLYRKLSELGIDNAA
eukprot:gene4399-4446_t